jgi:hypothetical protein
MNGFSEFLESGRACNEGIAFEVPDSWHQGRTAYGGFSSALALYVAQQVGGHGLPPLRSGQLAMMAPVAGPVVARARVERTGRNATWVSAEILGDKGLAFAASFVFMGAVESAIHINDRPVPNDLVPVEQAGVVSYSRHTPAFLANHFECRHARPPSDGKLPEMCRWVRLVDDAKLDPMVEMLLLGDALPPGVMPLMHAAIPVSTMHWQVNLLTPAPLTRGGWWLLRSVGDYAEQGCSSQRMAIWNADGAPVMAGMQSVALFG